MIHKIKNILGCAIVLTLALGFTACTKEEPVADEWTANYVYIVRPHLDGKPLSFIQTHSSLGINGDVDIQIPLKIKLNKVSDTDVKVKLSLKKVDGFLPEDVLTFTDGAEFTIPAGKTEVVKILAGPTDWASYYSDEEAVTDFDVKIESIDPEHDQMRISKSLNDVKIHIEKGVKRDLREHKPAGARLDRSAWKMGFAEQPEIGEGKFRPWNALMDNSNWSYCFSGTSFWWITDLGSVQTLTGFEVYTVFGGSFCSKAYTIAVSEDGKDWKYLSNEFPVNPNATSYVEFMVPQTARYLYVGFLGGPAVSEFYVWGK